jgi:hypothetical protein
MAKDHYGDLEKVFLCDGDAIVIPTDMLLEFLKFVGTHASNCLPIKGTLQKDKQQMIQLIDDILGLDHHFGHNVGANLVFALEQLFANVFSSRANTRFAPTLGSPQRSHLAETMIKATSCPMKNDLLLEMNIREVYNVSI